MPAAALRVQSRGRPARLGSAGLRNHHVVVDRAVPEEARVVVVGRRARAHAVVAPRAMVKVDAKWVNIKVWSMKP